LPHGASSEAYEARIWWRYPMLWLIVGGPAAVVVASLFTAVLAVRGADPVLSHDESGGASVAHQGADALTPAMQARNHAASPKP
jgi:hypothetical protein